MDENSNYIQQIRLMANCDSDLNVIRSAIRDLRDNLDHQRQQSIMFNESIQQLSLLLVDLEQNFRRVTNPLLKLIVTERDSNCDNQKLTIDGQSSMDLLNSNENSNDSHSDSEIKLNNSTTVVSITNLNEFICDRVLTEYLRQNQILVRKCTPTLDYNERSRNFLVTVRSSDLDRLMNPYLWPRGVTVAVRGVGDSTDSPDGRRQYTISEYASVHGEREKSLPSLSISSGMSYWHS